MSEYNNFNGYDLQEQPQTPCEPIELEPQPGAAAPDYRSVTQASPDEGSSRGRLTSYGVISILGAIPPMGICCYGISAVIGLFVGIAGLRKHKGNFLCIAGIILCVLCIAYWIYSIVYTINHPEEFMQVLEQYTQMLEEMENTGGSFFAGLRR